MALYTLDGPRHVLATNQDNITADLRGGQAGDIIIYRVNGERNQKVRQRPGTPHSLTNSHTQFFFEHQSAHQHKVAVYTHNGTKLYVSNTANPDPVSFYFLSNLKRNAALRNVYFNTLSCFRETL